MLHCDGSVYELLPDMIDAGMQIFNPLQTDCAGMDPARIKREFGDKISFWGGGCDTHATLVVRHCRSKSARTCDGECKFSRPGVGLCSIRFTTCWVTFPLENVLAMIEAAHEFGQVSDRHGWRIG